MSDKKSKYFLYLVIFALLLSSVKAFDIFPQTSPGPLCQGETGIFADVIQDSGTEFQASIEGTASRFSTPIIFRNTIYTLVTPRSTTPTGTYSLNIIASSGGEVKFLTHDVEVKECQGYSITATENQKSICPCESTEFQFQLVNQGQFTNTYSLSVQGPASNLIELDKTRITLEPSESETIEAFITGSCDALGDYTFTVVVDPVLGTSIKSSEATLTVNACYDFEIQTDQDFVSFCENEQITIPITIFNKGTTPNTYNLDIDGPTWASLDKNSVDVQSQSSSTVNLIFTPSHGISGDFEIPFRATTDKGSLVASHTFKANVKTCTGVLVDIEKNQDKICSSLQNTYNVVIKNVGEKDQEYTLEITGPQWVSINQGRVSLNPDQEESIELSVNPSSEVSPGTYEVEIIATATDISQVSSRDSISITTVTQEECYQPNIQIQDNDIIVPVDSSATVPIIIENRGTNTAVYNIEISGTAIGFATIVPLTNEIELEPNKAETIHVYIAPSTQIAERSYSATISVRLKDTTILDSETINIDVTESVIEEVEIPEEVEEEGISIWTRIKNFFTGLFSREESPEQEPEIEEPNETEEPEEPVEEINDTEELGEVEVPEEELETPNLDRTFSYNQLIGIEESSNFIINEQQYQVTLLDITEDHISLIFESPTTSTEIEVGETQKVDIDKDGFYDISVTLNGFVEEQADIIYEKLESLEPVIIEEDTEETGPGLLSRMGDFIVSYRNQIIITIVIIILILIGIKTKFHKKVIEFFEEEIEEEIPEEKKEEPKEPIKEETEEKPKRDKEEKKIEKKETAKKKDKKEDKKPKKGHKKKQQQEDFEIIH